MKKFLSVLLIAAIALCLFGCQAPDASALPKYAFIVDEDNTYQVAFSRGFCQAAEASGVSCTVKYAKTAEEQCAAIEEAVKEGVKAIALVPVDETSLKFALSQADQAGIPVVTLDRPTDGADYFINQVDYEVITQTILDDIYKLTGGTGKFALVDTMLAGISFRPWVSYLEILMKDEKYANLQLVDTIYCDDETVTQKVEDLITSHSDVGLLYFPHSSNIDLICRMLEEKASAVRVTGLANPAVMKDLVGNDRACPFFYLWDAEKMGADAFTVLKAILDGNFKEEDTVFSPAEGEEYVVSEDYLGPKTIYISSLIQFNEENISYWGNIY